VAAKAKLKMKINPFLLERYFAKYEFRVQYLLSPSDCESLPMVELLQMANPQSQELWQGLKLGYTESQGHPLLRAEIAKLYQYVTPDNVLVAAPEEAIFIAMQTLLTPDDHVIVLSPAYQSLHEIARSIGCRVTPWTLEPAAKDWRLDLGQLERSITERTRMLVINFPHNPTGYLATRGELDFIVELARKYGLYLFSDEMYRLLEYNPAARLPPVCDIYEKGISLSGLSKTFALPGLRIGWLAAQESSLMERWIAFKDYTTICSSAPSEILGIIALQNKEQIIQRSLSILHANIDLAGQFFADHEDHFAWLAPLAGSVAFPRWKGPGTVVEFCRGVLDQQGVMVVPVDLFGFPG
jgi:aspartate/methionine/tyrosine aminotransferase